MRFTPTLSSIAVAALLAAATTGANAAAPLIDVQFSNDASHTQTGAAVIGHAGDDWNNFTTGQAGSGSLLDTTGQASGVSLSFTADFFWESDPGYTQFTGTPYANLMQGYLVDRGSDIKLNFTGLTAGQEYGFWVYTQGDDNSWSRSISLSASNGTTAVTTQTNIGTFALDNNYAFVTAFADAQGDVTLSGKTLVSEGNIDGVQVTAVPEPSEMALLMAGLAFVAGAAVRRRDAR